MKGIGTPCVRFLTMSFLVVALISGMCIAQAKKKASGTSATKKQSSSSSGNVNAGTGKKDELSTGLLDIKISSSRKEVTPDAAYGIFAEVENTSTVPITIYAEETILVVQPEATFGGKCNNGISAYFPTAFARGKLAENSQTLTQTPPATDPRGLSLTIQSKEHFTIFWNISHSNLVGNEDSNGNAKSNKDTTAPKKLVDPCTDRHWYDVLSFVPGDYAFVVDAKLHLSPNQQEEVIYHTITERTTLRVSITQLTAMFAAMFGAVIAYFVTSLQPNKDFDRLKKEASTLVSVFRIIRNFFAAALMGATIAIVSSRLADTQFPIKVSVNDFWGAVTIGFLSYFIGDKFIEKLIGSVKSTPPPRSAVKKRPIA
jgi:hypothetical protein